MKARFSVGVFRPFANFLSVNTHSAECLREGQIIPRRI